MSAADRELTALFQVLRILREEPASPAHRVERLYEYLFESGRRGLEEPGTWSQEELERVQGFAEEVITRYTQLYCDPRVIPVTYYKREKRVRRHLDQQFSLVFREIARRNGLEPVVQLITEEPIYFLKQQAREKRFPKSRDGRPSLAILRTRFHLALSRKLLA